MPMVENEWLVRLVSPHQLPDLWIFSYGTAWCEVRDEFRNDPKVGRLIWQALVEAEADGAGEIVVTIAYKPATKSSPEHHSATWKKADKEKPAAASDKAQAGTQGPTAGGASR